MASREAACHDVTVKRLLPLLFVLLIAGSPALRAQDEPAPATQAEVGATASEPVPAAPPRVVKTFKAAEVRSHLNFLASKKCAGRASGTPGCDLAGAYLEEQIQEIGLEPAGDFVDSTR